MTIMRQQSFPPLVPDNPKILILGTMPGIQSLERQQYYAHPHNLFWPMISAVCGEPLPEAYLDRITLLLRHQIALWDVCGSCLREGSLDSAIREEQPNDIRALLIQYTGIQLLAFNGQKAAALFRKYFKDIRLPTHVLPSSSPAHAGKSRIEKEKEWLLLRSYL